MRIIQLMASPFFGGPERQVLGLALSLPQAYETIFLSFAEHGQARAFLDHARGRGFLAIELKQNTPHLWAAVREVAEHLHRLRADLLCCSVYKPDLIGWLAARWVGIPVMAIAHGWTAATYKVRLYEALDRWILRWMDCTVCVSAAQAEKVLDAGVPADRVHTICNAIEADAFAQADPLDRERLLRLFPQSPRVIVGGVGRLSPEKGFHVLVEAAALSRQSDPGVGFVLFGDGPLRPDLERQIAQLGLQNHFILAGFRTDVPRFLPHLDLLAMPSFTEGLPVALLEAFAAGLPVVATAVGGIPEVVDEGVNGHLVPSGDVGSLARGILDLAAQSKEQRRTLGIAGNKRVRESFSRESQAEQYRRLFDGLVRQPRERLRKWPVSPKCLRVGAVLPTKSRAAASRQF